MSLSLKSIPLYVLILAGMVVGVLIGFVAVETEGQSVITDWIKPFGEIFMRLLKFVAIPLVFVSLVKGVANLGNVSALSKLGLRTISLYIGTTIIAVVVGLTLAEVIAPGKIVPSESVGRLQDKYNATVAQKSVLATQIEEKAPLDSLVEIFPENLINAMSRNDNMLSVIFIALFVGVAILIVGKDATAPLMKVIDSLNAVILKMIDLIMKLAPIGVAALIAGMVSDTAGDLNLLGALGLYALTVIIGLLTLIFIFYPLLIKLFTKIPVSKFLKSMIPVQLMAFTTSSSAATLPLNMKTAKDKLGVSEKTVSFVLPVGMTINMDGTSCYQAISAVFIAQVLGIELGLQQMLILIMATVISSIGTPGIPGGGIVILIMVLTSVGIPPEGLALILGMDRPLDMLRTAVNVTGDVAVAAIVDQSTDPHK